MSKIPRDERGRFLPFAHLREPKRRKWSYLDQLIPFAIFLALAFWGKYTSDDTGTTCIAQSESRAGVVCTDVSLEPRDTP